ncbi:hypothetical protein BD310DRAFT_28614 [Dichomitus squalens]|uniref:Uncharacterized protein n=1 Tax=Dichomitus squalens TaxID=114155 RepID=A0A4Q9QDL9_9APHY|nr:hypothetical protein BD310DRAFT_28614 [Dichomitus squalens]
MEPKPESRNDESQASQLLAAALLPRVPQPAPPVATPAEASQVQESPLHLHSDSNHSVHYHIHGLGATQSLYGSEDQPYPEGSQKENTPASWDKDKHSQPSSPSRAHPLPSYTPELRETPSNVFPLAKVAKEKKSCPKDLSVPKDLSSPKFDPNPPLNPRKTPLPAPCRSRTPQRRFLRQPRTSISLCLNLAKCLSYRPKRTVLLPSLSIYGLLESLIPFSVNPRLLQKSL